MNTTDLRNLLAERAHSGAPDPAADVRVTGALNRARSIHRRRRITAATTAVAAVAIAVAIVTVPSQLTAPDPVPQPAEELNEHGFPLYQRGWELIDSEVMPTGEQSVDLNVTPTAFPLVIATECSTTSDIDSEIRIAISVHGEQFSESSCGVGFASNDPGEWGDRDVAPGQPVTYTLTSDPAPTASERVAFAAYRAVPWDEYRFPPRPDDLPDLPPPAKQVNDVLNSDPDDPNAPQEFVLDHAVVSIDLVAQSPGILRLRIDGVEVDPIYSWDYGYRPLFSLQWPPLNEDMRPGEPPIRVEVQPEGFTGSWQLHVSAL